LQPSAQNQGRSGGHQYGLGAAESRSGASWQNVTPPGLPERSAIILIEASPTEAETAYAIASAGPILIPTSTALACRQTWQKIVTD